MKIGIPRERKPLEGRVALTPAAVRELIADGNEVRVETGAGVKAGFADADFRQSGAIIADSLAEIYACDLVVKVKEPQPEEFPLLRPGLMLFCYLHLAACPDVLAQLLEKRVTAFAFETVTVGGRLPLLAPMSAIAGRIAVQIGMHYLQQPEGGAGLLLGGVMNTPPGKVVVLGAGVAGSHAAIMASALGADVWVLDQSEAALEALHSQHRSINCLRYDERALTMLAPDTDLLIGAVLLPGAEAPRLVSRALLAKLPRGRVVVDIAIDQGGCIEGIRPTDWRAPLYWEDGLGFAAVTNMPGAVPRTSAQALSRAILPHVRFLGTGDWKKDQVFHTALATENGVIRHPALLPA
ncbi:L-alanine dehydrogenase [Fluviicoccus keumensis]|uniref:alanine dehydrogenase n=1 Tax=Fluviicoccus keumensis TaxID=1435465 RepID=A0A4Q7Z4Q2_9GAMM|nr:alanine dehydrogenase [Fluviicoccus keumensis]RZU45287.1 L-alanine dehydrogenase [Fluviicoccus keumensis]